MSLRKISLPLLVLFALISFVLTACGDEKPTATPRPPVAEATSAPVFGRVTGGVGSATQVAIGITPPPGQKNTPRAATPTAGRTTAPANRSTPTAAVASDPQLTEKLPERTVIRTFTDRQGRAVKLTYGRGNGRSGDYGWAHIYGKHVMGIWYDGGIITTFPKTVGTKTPDDVVALVSKSITEDRNPDEQGDNRRSYVYPVPGTDRDVFTVVGSDGTIITSYPVKHGSKDEDN